MENDMVALWFRRRVLLAVLLVIKNINMQVMKL